jgi:hypothetical protein
VDAWFATLTEERPAPGYTVKKTAIPFAEDVWRELKWHLLDLFHGKCAYCETVVRPAYTGDVEHWRPKGKVEEDPTHPGYYWLAFDPSNLLPACMMCNQPAEAKHTHFPVDGAHARDATGLAAEHPLLLNPYDHAVDPRAHIDFDEQGTIKDVTPRGKSSWTIYDLNRPDLVEARFEAMSTVEKDWATEIANQFALTRKLDIAAAYHAVRARIEVGHDRYAAACLWKLQCLWQEQVQKVVSPAALPATSPLVPPDGVGT